ncbi:MAG: acyltransferase family protein [Albimonas sp.]|uniref:acyltransferase family protein n=1 Tax=Albimonas sp. TaxID=1872425 RepID=UPI0040560A88
MSKSIGYRRDVDGLRSIAVVPVILFHAGLPGVGGGYVGVDVFFVISGFLITSILRREIEERRFSIVDFYERRARRILPALFAVIAFTLLGCAVIQSPGLFLETGKATIATVLFGSNFLFWKTDGYFAPALELQPLLHTWSLAVEEQFYILFPPLLTAMAALGARGIRWLLAAAIAGSFALAVHGVATGANWAFFLLPPRAWELGIGAALAYGMAPSTAPRAVREAVGAAGLIGTLAPVVLYSSHTPFPGLAAAPPVLGAAALIWAGGAGGSAATRLLSLAPLVWVGLISYSLYLWHWPILVLLRAVTWEPHLSPQAQALAIGATVLLAWLSWRFVERPFRTSGDRGGVGRRAIFAGSALGMLLLGAAGGVAYLSQGAPWRFPPEIQAIYASARFDNGPYDACGPAEEVGPFCRLDPTRPIDGPQDVLYWGDSHATMLMSSVDHAVRARGWLGSVYVREGCPPALGFNRSGWGGAEGCSRSTERLFDELERRDDIDTVIVAANWVSYIDYEPPLQPGMAPEYAPAPGYVYEGEHARQMLAAMEAAVERILATGRQVVLLGPAPSMTFSVPERVAMERRWGLPPGPGRPRGEVEARQARSLAGLESLASRAGVALIPMTSPLCDAFCPYRRDGMPLYRDSNHLVPEEARRIYSDYLAQALAKL